MNEKYLPTNFQGRYSRVIEESGEVLQMCGKIGRFGLFSRHPKGGDHNATLLLGELRDLQHAISELETDLKIVIDHYDSSMIRPRHMEVEAFLK